jgi:hypothetical protein
LLVRSKLAPVRSLSGLCRCANITCDRPTKHCQEPAQEAQGTIPPDSPTNTL